MIRAMPVAASDARTVLARGMALDVRPSTEDVSAIVGESGRGGVRARIVSLAGHNAQAIYEEMEWE